MKPRLLFVLFAVCALGLLPAGTASAHPLGNFTVNRYDGLVAAPGRLRVDHVEDLAEIPATQAAPDLKRLGLAGWARQRCARAAEGSRLTVGGRPATLTAGRSTARLRPGQAGLRTLRLECRLTAPLPRGRTVALGFHGAGADGGPGWREITARGDRMTLTATDVPKTSVSHELTTYPKDLLSSPADTTGASLRVRPGGPALTGDRQDAPGAGVLPRGADRFTRALDDLVARHDLTVGFAALALLIAVALGAMHALAPGHGKTLMAATAAARGGRARLRDVLPLAASVTVTHTLGVVALGLLVTAGSAATPSVIAWLGIASGVLVLVAGVNLVRRAWHSRAHMHPRPEAHSHEAAGERPLALVGAHPGAAGAGHHHGHDGRTHRHGHHDHHHDHDHDHDGGHHHHGGVVHTHGGHTHSHPTAPTLRGTILLGFAGGLVPSPSAVVVLVGAAALGKAWFGLLLVVAYGAGLALTLSAAGFAVVRLGAGATRVLDRRPRWTAHPLTALVRRTLPLVSASVVLALGIGLVLKGAASALG
ncbi:ABC-type nickel/cobalt efflux system, permease component RcnA [Streptomyces sp. 1222.5]|uniref:HoxN/HupN/NixA family nickel/cobalt transporter n=1 Tax=unclassified Streptomyces TaxID=2593676 RepID=UPI000896D1C3|nr:MULTISPECIES: nickel transporter [unclassified Streptomyces]PKW06838.1 ABC-type nickel/cobalt efflux system permease component RcnA [Streptomyces sp. 5112.2]SED04068.1 ABC-type nickel/cobalt efflux system, permease component RcnA [Streptomyces sp. 1222.5]